MKHNTMQDGFFIYEFLIYLFLFSFLAIFLMKFVVASCLQLKKQSYNLHHLIGFSGGFDAIIRDLKLAPSSALLWKKIEHDCLIWHDAATNTDKGFYMHKGKIFHIQGMYNEHLNSWHKKIKNLVLDHVVTGNFFMNHDLQTTFITVDCLLQEASDNSFRLCKTIALYNGMII